MKSHPPRLLIVAALLLLSAAAQEKPSTSLDEARSLYEHGRWNEAAKAYRDVLIGTPNSVDAEVGLTRSLIKAKNVPDALEAARKAVTLDPKSAAAHTAMGEVDFRRGLISEAQQEFADAN